MPTIEEILGLPVQELNGALVAGIDDISQYRQVAFYTYSKAVLPADGFVFWLRTGAFTASGMLHHAADRTQDEADTSTVDSVVFTTKEPIVALNQQNSDTLIVGLVEGVRYAFVRHALYAEQAAIWHYQGNSITADLGTQLIDDPSQFDNTQLIVSNSLPAWLQIVSYTPIWLVPPNPGITLYPSYLVPDNLTPPYGVVHIDPDGIRALQAVPLLLPINLGGTPPVIGTRHTQLSAERVRVTLYGANNNMAQDFLDTVLRYSLDTDVIGLMNMPIVRDGKSTWPEGMIIAQQKFIDFEVSYIQTRTIAVAQQMILSAQTTVSTFADP